MEIQVSRQEMAKIVGAALEAKLSGFPPVTSTSSPTSEGGPKGEPSAPEPTERTAWLHGWTWWPGHVDIGMGTAFYCVGCGKFFGTGAVVFEEGWKAPGPEPEWPFPEEGCPLCALRGKDSDLHDKVSRYESVLYAHGIPLSTMPSQPLSKAQREAIRRNLP